MSLRQILGGLLFVISLYAMYKIIKDSRGE